MNVEKILSQRYSKSDRSGNYRGKSGVLTMSDTFRAVATSG